MMKRYIHIQLLLIIISINANVIDVMGNDFLFTITEISESKFKKALGNNYNASFTTEVTDSAKIEKALGAITETYNEWEKELADSEMCSSPTCLTSFEAYYPTLDIYLFYILDFHYEKACFVSVTTNEVISGYNRFRGSYGVMSKDGFFVGLERTDCDNFLQIEISKLSKHHFTSVIKFDFTSIDIYENEAPVMFWADKNTIYITTRSGKEETIIQYYSIEFSLEN